MDITASEEVRVLLLEKLDAEAIARALRQAEQMAKQVASDTFLSLLMSTLSALTSRLKFIYRKLLLMLTNLLV